MEKNKKITAEKLNDVPKDVLVMMYLQLLETMDKMVSQNNQLIKQVASLEEKICILNQRQFGRKTEKATDIDGAQLQIDLNTMEILNEAEYITDNAESSTVTEPDFEKPVIKMPRSKKKEKRELDLKYLKKESVEHKISEEKLNEYFPDGYYELPEYKYYTVEFVPATFVEYEHIVHKYAGKSGEGIRMADMPEKLLPNSVLTPSLASAVFNSKYVNAIPLNRLSEDFGRLDMNISRQTLANWMISISERYMEPVYDIFHKHIMESKLIHCDETPFKMVGNGKGPNSKEYM